jgi:PhnB protein
VTGVPKDSAVVIPRLVCRDVAAEMTFCATTFGAEGGSRPGPDGKPAHALLKIGPAMIMIEREWPSVASRPPARDATSPVVIFIYVEDVDATIERAVGHGATVLSPPANQFWGDRVGWIMDPEGHVWTVATRIEDTSEEQRRDRWSKIRDES